MLGLYMVCLKVLSCWAFTFTLLCIYILQWTVNGTLRVGFFVRKPIKKDEEITFDYKYEVYGWVTAYLYFKLNLLLAHYDEW